ncbi:EAL domain-containing protein [Vibrio sp. MA40-2]|uniref:EAL domain-containing protein n=1 Tax=Vibrio sp. MA40-2 TaxID=3391828 RepID=UPI0039A745BC
MYKYKYKRLLILSSNLPVLLTINIGIASTLVMANIYESDIHNGKLSWLFVLYAVTGIRFLIHHFVSNENKYKLDFHLIGVIAAGIAWASYPYVFHQSMATKEIMFTLIIFCGMSGGSVNLLSSDLRSALAFVSLTVFPYSYVLITGNDPSLVSLGVMGVAFGIALCITAIKSAQLILSFIENQSKIENLLSNLEIESDDKTNLIRRMEQRDKLTGLFNRENFSSVIAMKRAKLTKPTSANGFILIDVEQFHIINHNFGHHYGDQLISKIGSVLIDINKSYGSSSARYGIDEFIIHIDADTEFDIIQFIEKIRAHLTVCFQFENIRINPDYHIGYYFCDDSILINQATRNAYLAVTEAKKNNIRIYRFDREIQKTLKRNKYIQKAIKTAIENKSFYMNFQPIIGSVDKKIHSFESLVRWKLKGKFISPDEFISIAEEHGLIVELGRLILNMSIEALARVNETYPDISISINVSVIQLENDDFLGDLQHQMTKYKINPNNVHLEITETAMITDICKLSQIIHAAKDLGVMISVDDFGTGFSSISVLRNLQIDYIKIDKSYIDGICSCEKERSIVSAVTKMAHTIDTQVIAEGVESNEQLDAITQSDIDFYQGYLFSKPVSFKEMMSLLSMNS